MSAPCLPDAQRRRLMRFIQGMHKMRMPFRLIRQFAHPAPAWELAWEVGVGGVLAESVLDWAFKRQRNSSHFIKTDPVGVFESVARLRRVETTGSVAGKLLLRVRLKTADLFSKQLLHQSVLSYLRTSHVAIWYSNDYDSTLESSFRVRVSARRCNRCQHLEKTGGEGVFQS